MLEIPVKLIVKAPNQQVEDQTVHCSLSWTIKKLKGHLSEVHPSRPKSEDQRLIYYGQLLNDSVTLKDVFTKYEAGEETHTVHLVCMPSKETLKMQARKLAEENSKKAKERSSGGPSTSSQRPASNENQNITEGNAEFSRSAERNYFQSGYQNWIAGLQSQDPATNNYIQQWNWMQQAYANYYMNHYLNMVARQNALGIREGTRQDEDVRNPVPQHRDVEDDDNHINRDWLDCLYIMSRFVVLLSIVYFYSSPMRFIIVSTLGMALYLYQIGFFRLHQLIEENEVVNNNVPVNNNNVIPLEEVAEEEREEEEEEEGAPPAQPNPNPDPNPNQNQNSNPSSSGEQAVEALDHPSFIARTWIFVATFFSSMIPETENPI